MLQNGQLEQSVSGNKVEQLTIVELAGQQGASEDRAIDSPGPGHSKSGASSMKSAHKLAAAVAVLLILIGAAYFILTSLKSVPSSSVPDTPTPPPPPPAAAETSTPAPAPETITSTKTLFPLESGSKPGDSSPVESAGSEPQQAVSQAGSQQDQQAGHLTAKPPVALATRTSPQLGAIFKDSTLVRLIRPEEAALTTSTTTMSTPTSDLGASVTASETPPEITSTSTSTTSTTTTTTTTTTTAPQPVPSSAAPESPPPAPPVAGPPVETLAEPTSDGSESTLVQPIDVERLYESATTKRPVDQLEPVELAKWDEFKRKYGKVYPSLEEERNRLETFAGNLRFITAFNRNAQALFQLDVNKFADLSRNETNFLFIGPQIAWAQTLGQASSSPPPMRILPDQWVQASESLRSADWRNLTSDEPVDQGLCRDSSIFAIVASLESALNAALVTTPAGTGPATKVKLSEQQILDCLAYMGPAPSASSPPICSGHLSMVQALDFLQRQAIRLASAPEYADFKLAQSRGLVAANSCVPPPGQQPGSLEVRPKLGSYDQVHRDNIDEALLNRGPLIVAIDASQPTFHFYKSGIYHDLGCSSDAYSLHALLVAYAPANSDGDTNLAHYTIRASLGSAWGELGHMRLLKDASRNKCLPQHLATYPNIAYE